MLTKVSQTTKKLYSELVSDIKTAKSLLIEAHRCGIYPVLKKVDKFILTEIFNSNDFDPNAWYYDKDRVRIWKSQHIKIWGSGLSQDWYNIIKGYIILLSNYGFGVYLLIFAYAWLLFLLTGIAFALCPITCIFW